MMGDGAISAAATAASGASSSEPGRFSPGHMPSPEVIKSHLDRYVIGQDEVKRVLDGASRSRFRQRAQESQRQQEQRQYQRQQEGSRARHGDTTHASSTRSDDWRAMDDYALLGLQRTPPPSPSEIASSFRRQAMKWHPDHNQDKSDADRRECEERFKAINSAHGRLRREAKAARGG